MSEAATRVQIAAANAYESLFVTALFQEWAPRVIDAARIRPEDSVLDVACGTGVLARQALLRVGPEGSVTGLDVSPGMLAVAQELTPAVEWRLGLAEALPFPNQAFDAVVSQFGLMFFNDRSQALQEMLRVLEPRGRLAVAVWGAVESMPAYAAMIALLDRVGGRRAGDALRAPFALGRAAEVTRLFEAAGIESLAVTTDRGTARFPNIRTLVEADVRGWLPAVGVELPEAQIERILDEAETELAPYRTPDGPVVFETTAIIASGTKPSKA